MELEGIFSLLDRLNFIINEHTAINNFQQQFNQLSGSYPNKNDPRFYPEILKITKELDTRIDRTLFRPDELDIIRNWGLNISDFIDNALGSLTANVSNGQNAYIVVTNLNNQLIAARSSLNSLLAQFRPFREVLADVGIDYGLVEYLFQGGARIENVADLKKESEDLFLIVYGYAQVFNMTPEDFELFRATKSSPFSAKIKTASLVSAFVISTVAGVYKIANLGLQNKLLIEQIKGQEILDEQDKQEFIQKAELKHDTRIDKELDTLTKNQLLKHQQAENGEIYTALRKSIQIQYVFIMNGGDVKLIQGEGVPIEDVRMLETAKQELKLIKESDTMKLLSNSSSSDVQPQ